MSENKQRFMALDVMRGLTLALMILVNTPGSWSHVYAPLLHADWHGATFTDYIFPFFLFIVGSAMFFSHRTQSALPLSSRTLKIIKRTLLLFLVGVLLNAYPFTDSLDNLRIMGVLQRIALAYCAAAFIIWLPLMARIAMAALLLLGYWALLSINADPYSLTGNIVRDLDLWLLGADHLWQGKGVAFDPEGVLSTLPAIVNVLIGFEAARILVSVTDKVRAQWQLVAMAAVLIVAGGLWHLVFPLNKYLWTSSFVLLTSGAAIVTLLVLVWLEKIPALMPLYRALTMLGKNPLFIYVLSIVWVNTYFLFSIGDVSLYTWLYQQLALVFSPRNASLLFALLHVAIFWLVAWWLDRRRIVISL